jgi:hypothetical protein
MHPDQIRADLLQDLPHNLLAELETLEAGYLEPLEQAGIEVAPARAALAAAVAELEALGRGAAGVTVLQ